MSGNTTVLAPFELYARDESSSLLTLRNQLTAFVNLHPSSIAVGTPIRRLRPRDVSAARYPHASRPLRGDGEGGVGSRSSSPIGVVRHVPGIGDLPVSQMGGDSPAAPGTAAAAEESFAVREASRRTSLASISGTLQDALDGEVTVRRLWLCSRHRFILL
jgi:hypothetical protein